MGNLMLKRDYGLLGVKTKIKITPLLYGEKLSAVEVSPAYPIYPERSNYLCISLQNVANSLHVMKEKVGSSFVMVRWTFSEDRRIRSLRSWRFLLGRGNARRAADPSNTDILP